MGRRDSGAGTPANADEQQTVVDFLAAIVSEAWRKADLLASHLVPASERALLSADCSPALATDEQIAGHPNADLWLEMGTALRLRQWEQSGVTAALPVPLPSFEEALNELRQGLEVVGPDERCRLTRQQLDAWIRYFAWRAPEMLGIDAVLNGTPSVSDVLLDQLAELLWSCRETHCAREGESE